MTHNIDLKIIIHFVCWILLVDKSLHVLNVLLCHIVLLDELTSISIDSVEFLENKIKSSLKRLIVVD